MSTTCPSVDPVPPQLQLQLQLQLVPDTSASVYADDDPPPLWSRPSTEDSDEDVDSDAEPPAPRTSAHSKCQASYGNAHGYHWTLPNGTMVLLTPDQKSFMKHFPKLLSEEHHDIRLWYEGLASFAAPHGFLVPPSNLIDSEQPLGFDWSSVHSDMQVQQAKWSVLIATALMQTGNLPACSSLIDIVAASNNNGYAALYSILQNVHPKLSLRPGNLTASSPRQKHNETILKLAQRCLDFFNLEDGTTLTNYLALPGAPKPVVKKAFWGNKTPYGDRNSSSYGNRNGNRDVTRETRNVSFTNDADLDEELDSTVDLLVHQLASKKATDAPSSASAAPCTICNRHPDTTKCHRLQEHLAMSDYIEKHPNELELLISLASSNVSKAPHASLLALSSPQPSTCSTSPSRHRRQ